MAHPNDFHERQKNAWSAEGAMFSIVSKSLCMFTL